MKKALIASAALAALSPFGATAADRTLTISVYAFAQDDFKTLVYDPFEAKCGCKLVVETGNSVERLAKMEANKANPVVDLAAVSMPVLGKLETAQAILGATGIPTSGRSLPEASALAESDAFSALCRWLERDGQHRILALGPLTNIAAVALARPDLAARIDDLVWMGGGVTLGNHTASAEFNALADPEALSIVIAHDDGEKHVIGHG